MKEGVSIIICCFNSALRLPKTLEYLANQIVDNDISWELILVDNNCTDNTVQIAKEEWSKHNHSIELNIFFENNPGLHLARKKGVENSKFNYCIFCDDDNWLAPNYINIMYHTFLMNKAIGIIGGNSIAVTEISPPIWFKNFEQYYATGVQAKESCYVTKNRRFVFGAGMGIKKSLFETIEKLNFKSPITDRKGSELSSGGDIELCYLSILLGYEIYYNSELKFVHFINKNRLTKEYLYKLFDGFAKADNYLLILYNYLSKPYKNKRIAYFNQIFFILKFLRIYKKSILKIILFKLKPEHSILITKYYLRQIKFLIFNRRKFYNFIDQILKIN